VRSLRTIEQDLLSVFAQRGALREGHFLLSSGRHADRYVQCAAVLEDPRLAEAIAKTILDGLTAPFDRVLAAPMGGLLIGHEVARAAGVRLVFPERNAEGAFQLRRGFAINPGERLCVIEDVITTGRTTRELLALAQHAGATVAGLGAVVDRSANHVVDGHPIHAALVVALATYAPEDCPLCAAGAPITQPGSRPAVPGGTK
jgi:orotate phosphoribosyltransferase